MGRWESKLACTDWERSRVTSHDPVPEQPAPLQPMKSDAPAAVAVSVTRASCSKLASHVSPHRIPAGRLVTEPVPLPVGRTLSV